MAQDQRSAIGASSEKTANEDAAWTLVRWIGIPLVLVGALYFIERKYDERPFVVVVNHGDMRSPEEIAATPPAPMAPTATPGPAVDPALAPTAPPSAGLAPVAPGEALRPLSQPSPPYPPRALEREREGYVRLRLTIAPDGSVSDAQVLHAEPRGWFERAAQDGVKRWRYAASQTGGTTDVDVEFKLK